MVTLLIPKKVKFVNEKKCIFSGIQINTDNVIQNSLKSLWGGGCKGFRGGIPKFGQTPEMTTFPFTICQ